MSDAAAMVAFLEARLDEDEAGAKACQSPSPWKTATHPADSWIVTDATGEPVIYDEGTPSLEEAAHIARHDPARVLRDVEADRALLSALGQARKFSDHMFSSPSPEGAASGEVPGERVRAATQVLTLERVVMIRAARFSDHPGYSPAWAPA